MILTRYLIYEISRPLALTSAALVAIFASYCAADYLADAVGGLLPAEIIGIMILLKIAIALEVLLPTTLYLSVVIALGRMHRDSEMVALEACGFGALKVFKPVVCFACGVAALTAVLSLYIRPWAYGKIYELKARAQSIFDISRMEAGNFYELESAGLVVFAENVNHRNKLGESVFIRNEDGNSLKVILAEKVYAREDPKSHKQVLLLENGYMYDFLRTGEKGKISEFQNAVYVISPKSVTPQRYRSRAASSMHLASSQNLEDIAELQWRLSTPVSTLLLALLGVLLSRTTARQGKYGKTVTAVIAFAVYYNMTAVAKNWVEKGSIGTFPGMWWVQLSLAALIVILAWRQDVIFFRRTR